MERALVGTATAQSYGHLNEYSTASIVPADISTPVFGNPDFIMLSWFHSFSRFLLFLFLFLHKRKRKAEGTVAQNAAIQRWRL